MVMRAGNGRLLSASERPSGRVQSNTIILRIMVIILKIREGKYFARQLKIHGLYYYKNKFGDGADTAKRWLGNMGWLVTASSRNTALPGHHTGLRAENPAAHRAGRVCSPTKSRRLHCRLEQQLLCCLVKEEEGQVQAA